MACALASPAPVPALVYQHWEFALDAQRALRQRLDVQDGQLLSTVHPDIDLLRMYSGRLKSIQCALESSTSHPLTLCMENAYHHFSQMGSHEPFVSSFMRAYDRVVPVRVRTSDMKEQLRALWTNLQTHLSAVWVTIDGARSPYYHALHTLSDSLSTIIESSRDKSGLQMQVYNRSCSRDRQTLCMFGKVLFDLIHTIMPQSEARHPVSKNGQPGAKVLILWESRLLVCMELILEHGPLQVLLPCLPQDEPQGSARGAFLHAYNVLLTLFDRGLSSVGAALGAEYDHHHHHHPQG